MARKPITSKAAAERLAVIRRQTVQRHHKAAAVTKLCEEIQRHTANRICRWNWVGCMKLVYGIVDWMRQAWTGCMI